jgi:hypothetical protein
MPANHCRRESWLFIVQSSLVQKKLGNAQKLLESSVNQLVQRFSPDTAQRAVFQLFEGRSDGFSGAG